MMKKKKKNTIFNNQFFLLVLGSILILFGSTYIFTRSAIINSFDFNETGEIGDTIGGITSPVINIIGSILIYISFKAQINANKIQFKAMKKEIQNQKFDRNFEIALDLYKELKNDYKILEQRDRNGKSVPKTFTNEIDEDATNETLFDYIVKPIYIDWKFILCEYDLVIYHTINSKMRKQERNKIFTIVYNFYVNQLENSIENIVLECGKYEFDRESNKMIEKIKIMHKMYLENDYQKINNG